MAGHKFTKVLFAVEHDGKAYGVGLRGKELEQLLAYAAQLSPGGSLELYLMPNQQVFDLALQPSPTMDPSAVCVHSDPNSGAVCEYCAGDGYHAVPRTPGVDCEACKGTGKRGSK